MHGTRGWDCSAGRSRPSPGLATATVTSMNGRIRPSWRASTARSDASGPRWPRSRSGAPSSVSTSEAERLGSGTLILFHIRPPTKNGSRTAPAEPGERRQSRPPYPKDVSARHRPGDNEALQRIARNRLPDALQNAGVAWQLAPAMPGARDQAAEHCVRTGKQVGDASGQDRGLRGGAAEVPRRRSADDREPPPGAGRVLLRGG